MKFRNAPMMQRTDSKTAITKNQQNLREYKE